MPQRTKRQKIASKMRREKAAVASQEPKVVPQESSVAVFKHDFKKSLLIITIITALEIITYFGTMYYHLK